VVRTAVYITSTFLYVTTSRANFQPSISQDIYEKKAKDKTESPFTKDSP